MYGAGESSLDDAIFGLCACCALLPSVNAGIRNPD